MSSSKAAGVLICAIVALFCQNLQAQNVKQSKLKGLPAVQVVVEDLGPEGDAIGLQEDELKSYVEMVLRQGDVQVVDSSSVFLYLNLNLLKLVSGNYAVSGQLSLNEPVYFLERGSFTTGTAATWEIGSVGVAQRADSLRSSASSLIGRFLTEYSAANQEAMLRERSSRQ
jgi:hypothetical protein